MKGSVIRIELAPQVWQWLNVYLEFVSVLQTWERSPVAPIEELIIANMTGGIQKQEWQWAHKLFNIR